MYAFLKTGMVYIDKKPGSPFECLDKNRTLTGVFSLTGAAAP